MATFEGTEVGVGGCGGVEEGDGNDAGDLYEDFLVYTQSEERGIKRREGYLVWAAILLKSEFMLRDEIPMRKGSRLGEARRAAAKESRSRGVASGLLVVKRHPVCLAVSEQILPGEKVRRDGLALDVEDP